MLCQKADPTVCDTELVRNITSYGREGEWFTDISPLLPLFKEGGTRTIQYRGSNGYDLNVKILLWNAGKPWRPVAVRPLWGAGPEAISWDAAYNESMDAVTFTIDDAPSSHVELFSIISGHGAEGPESCAEFCAHQQEFAVNDTAFLKEYPEAGTMTGCMDKVSEGVVPNQFGTWPYGRAGWCPGQDVPPVVVDVSSALVSGENTVDYRALFDDEEYVPTGGGAHFRLSSWLVFYEAQN